RHSFLVDSLLPASYTPNPFSPAAQSRPLTADRRPPHMSYTEHQNLSRDTPVRCAVITVSDTRTAATDRRGALMKARRVEAGHEVAHYRIVPDEPAQVSALRDELAGNVEAVLPHAATAISCRDTTYVAVASKLEKALPG